VRKKIKFMYKLARNPSSGELRMDIIKGIRFLAAALLLFTGIAHLTIAALGTGIMADGSALFGVLYLILGIGLLTGRRLFNYLGAVITILGLIVGAYAYVAISPAPVILPLAVVDVIIISCCFYLILQKTNKPRIH
jgi:hypothetical protein